MPNTPSVNFNFINNNVQTSIPQLGISHVLARTTKGPFNKPDEVLSTYAQFQAIYGEEIVPDGSISNIKKAFELGSKLRVSRVAGATDPAYGYANTYSSGAGNALKDLLTLILTNPANSEEKVTVTMGFKTREQGSAIVDPNSYGLDRDFYLKVHGTKAAKTFIYLTQAKSMTSTGEIANDQVLDTRALISYGDNFIDVATFRDFVNNAPNVEIGIVDIVFSPANPNLTNKYKSNGAQGLIALLTDHDTWKMTLSGSTLSEDLVTKPLFLVISEGNNGGASDKDTWIAAFEAMASYEDGYALACSHIHQHIPSTYTEVYKAIADVMIKSFESVLYVEVPKTDLTGKVRTAAETKAALQDLVAAVGQDKSIAYFGGGIKYYDDQAVIRNCDVIGTVLGLGDVAASNYGPWYSFAGMNRGIVATALGSVMENLGSSTKKPVLQSLAEWYMNLFVIKDTRNMGKRTMLWHSFTSHPKADSYRFLSVVRLNLYIKKNLRPILESYIEEPNHWNTWKNIYFEVKDIFTNLVDKQAITEWRWLGDQDVQSYADLSVNNEADVRAGKYHAQVVFKDVVTMQEITMDIITDASAGTIEIAEL